MAWELLEKPRMKQATKKMAQEHCDMDAAPRSNKFSPKKALAHLQRLENGTMRPISWAIVYCKETDRFHRLNGKHTSFAITKLITIPDNLYITIEEYVADTLQDVSDLFATFDTREAARKAHEIYINIAGSIPALATVPDNVIRICVAGLAIHHYGVVSHANRTAEEKGGLLRVETDFVCWANHIFHGGRAFGRDVNNRKANWYITRSPVVAAMIHAWKERVDHATVFWCYVRDESDPNTLSLSRQLAEFLKNYGVDSRQGNSMNVRSMYQMSLQVWDALLAGKKGKIKHDPSYPIPRGISYTSDAEEDAA